MFSNCKSMVANDPRDGATFDTRGMAGMFYEGHSGINDNDSIKLYS